MARITVEDCLENVENRFDLVLKAAQRARELSMGTEATLPWQNDKPTVMALREIAEGTIRTKPMEAAEHFDLPGLNPEDEASAEAQGPEAADMAAALDAFNVAASDVAPTEEGGDSAVPPTVDGSDTPDSDQ